MPKNYGTVYTILFAAGVCVFCSIFVSASAVSLKDRQDANKLLDKQKNVLFATGIIKPDSDMSRQEIMDKFDEKIRALVVDMKTGELNDKLDAKTYDQRFASGDASQSEAAPSNPAKVSRVPHNGLVYHVMDGDKVSSIVLPVQGMGLWSTMYAYLALDADTTTIRGIAFYEQAETPGLGGEVGNPKWTAKWVGRKAFNEQFEPVLALVKGAAGPISEDPNHVDGLTGATLTANGVTHLVQFWLSDTGYGPYLKKFREQE